MICTAQIDEITKTEKGKDCAMVEYTSPTRLLLFFKA